MLIGGHVSAAGGISNSPARAKAIGANCMQIFGSSPRQWQVRIPEAEEVEQYKKELKKHKIESVYLHAPYLINLASYKKGLQKISYHALRDHFKICSLIGAEGLIFHLGSHKETTLRKGISQTISAVKKILKEVSGKSQLILEVSSGGGSKIGDSLEQLALLFNGIKDSRASFCFDTAHAFTAGMIDYSPASTNKFIKEWDEMIGLKNISVIHVNDSRADFGSKVDRHENLGKGKIGLSKLKRFAARAEFRKIPWLLEVPGISNEGPDKQNVNILKRMLK